MPIKASKGAALKQQAVVFLRFFANKVVEISHQLQDFFRNGSFGIAVYPILMHPCVRASGRFFLLLASVFASFLGVFYIFAEFVTAIFSDAFIGAYFKHTTLELLVPLGTVFEGEPVDLSPLSAVMRGVFTLQGMLFWAIYVVAIQQLSRNKYWLLGVIFAAFFSIGMLLSTSAQGKFGTGGLQNLGSSLTYLFGTLAVLLAGIDFTKPHLHFIRRYSLRAGAMGTLCIFITIFLPNSFTPLLERVGIYAIAVWEILIGFALLKRK